MATAIDFAARFPDANAVKGAGHIAVLAYVSSSRPGSNFGAKPMRREHADAYRAAGVQVVSIWQYGKPGNPQAPSDWTTGYEGGRRMGLDALAAHRAAGGPEGRPVFFAVDEDISLADWNAKAVHFFRGVNDTLGRDRTGIYGSSKACAWAIEDNVIGESRTPGKRWAWQTRAWSGNKLDTPEAVLYQRVIDTPSSPGPQVDGVTVDVNDILAADYGQWSMSSGEVTTPVGEEKPQMGNIQPNPGHRGDPLFLPDVLRAFGLKVWEDPGWRTHGHGDFAQIQGVIAHHTAGGGPNDWLIVRDGRSDLPGPLSQLVLEKDGTYRVVAAGVCWHAGRGSWSNWPTNNANYTTIGIEAVSRGVQPWDWTDAQIDAYIRGVGAILWYLGKNADQVAGHKEYSSEGKIDPAGIDMNWFRGEVQKVIDAGPTGGGDAPMSAAEVKQIQDFIVGFCGPIGSDVKDIRQQITGGRDKDEYPGWPQLDNKTVVDALADVLKRLKALEAK